MENKINILCHYETDVQLKNKTWIHRGGRVDYWLMPKTIEELVIVGSQLYDNNELFITIGHTSNTYFKNTFNIKYVVDTRHLTNFSILDTNTLMCECGVPMAKVSRFCVDNGIAGYEGMVGLPGTVGGGIFCNSGCYGCGIEKKLKSIELLTEQGEVVKLSSKQLGFSFRTSSMKRGELKGIILRAYFDISKRENKSFLMSMAESYKLDRKETQDPPAWNLGSTVNFFGMKNNLRNTVVKILVRLYAHFTQDRQKRYLFKKRIICSIYGAKKIERYISNKRVNCFIWKDEYADYAYPSYLKMMCKVYDNCSVEIICYE